MRRVSRSRDRTAHVDSAVARDWRRLCLCCLVFRAWLWRHRGMRRFLTIMWCCLLALPCRADDFYAGRTITLLIGHPAGGGYDLYSRLLAAHLGRHVPGNPTVLPKEMVGAGGIRAASFIIGPAPRDGTMISEVTRTIAFDPLLRGQVKFDPRQLAWIGSISDDVTLCVTRRESPIRTVQDLLTRPVRLGGEGPASSPDTMTTLIRTVFGASNISLVTGYPGTADVTLAMLRGEIDGLCGLSWDTIRTAHGDWLRDRSVNLLVQVGAQRSPELPDLPALADFAVDARQKSVLKLVLAAELMARPFAAPPDMPPGRLEILRKAFDETMKDPQFQADAKARELDVAPMSGSAIDQLLRDTYATPPEQVAEARTALTPH